MESTAKISFSTMQTMLLSSEAPSTMSFAARSRSAVSSTTAGGLPGPAAMARLPEFIAAFTTAGYANPTLTNLALTTRVADEVKAVLQARMAADKGAALADFRADYRRLRES